MAINKKIKICLFCFSIFFQDPVNPMAIQCDEKLRDLLGCESISAVGINEMLRRHMYKQS
jgi:chromatin remodeling complex protein RSC6